MARDILGQDIKIGSKVLWGGYGGNSGFVGNAPMTVERLSDKTVGLRRSPRDRISSVPHGSVVVVDALVKQAPAQ